jgi:hypothetical protein
MTRHQHRSLKEEYELYVDREIEAYKESLSRSTLLGIGDEAVAQLRTREQIVLTELVVWEEVDRIIMRRLGLPTYQTWKRRRYRRLARFRRPEHWGFAPDSPIVRAIGSVHDSHVLVSGARSEGSALYLAANGCEVTAIEPQEALLERVMAAAFDAGITGRLHGYVSDLASYAPVEPLTAVICTPAAFAGLSMEERAQAIAVLQSATCDGGLHLVETLVAGQAVLTVDELAERYAGWEVSVERPDGRAETFLARKLLS